MTRRLTHNGTPVAHYLPYWHLDDGLLVNVDGSMAIAWQITGVDVTCVDNADVNLKTAALRRTVNAIPVGCTLQFFRRSRPLDDKFFSDYRTLLRSPQSIFQEQRIMSAEALRGFGLRTFETYAVLIKPNALGRFGQTAKGAAPKLLNSLFGRVNPLQITVDQHETARRELNDSAKRLENALAPTGAKLARLDGQGLLNLIFRFLNPSVANDQVPPLTSVLPRDLPGDTPPVYKDLSLREQVLRSNVKFDLDMLHLDDPLRPHRILAMKELPRNATPGALIRGAQKLAHDHWLAIGLKALDTPKLEGSIERRRNAASATAQGKYVRNAKADAERQELEEAMDEMAKRDQRLVEVNLHLLINGDDMIQLDDRTRSAIELFQTEMKITLSTAIYNQDRAWFGMQPGAGHLAPHARTVFTDNAADFIPIYSSATGSPRPLFVLPHRSGEPYLLDIANPKKSNWNLNIFGSSGKGKSYFTNGLLASSMLGQGSPVIIIDVGGRDELGNIIGSYYRQCQLAGGEYFEFSLDGKNAVNVFMPLAELYATNDGTPQPTPNGTKLNFLSGVIEMLVRDEGMPPLTTVQVGIINRAILAAYQRWGATRTPILEDLIPEFRAMQGDKEDSAYASAFAKTLQAWVAGPYGPLLNTPSKVKPRTNFTVFDMKGLEGLGRLAPVIMMILTSYVWGMIARPRNGLAWVIYDECWALLRDPTAARLQEELYRTARKLNAGCISVTQRLEDFLNSPTAQAVLANAENTFLLAHDAKVRNKVIEICGLNQREALLFNGLEMRKGYFSEVFFKPGEGSVDQPALLRYYATPLDYWMNSTDPRDRELEREVLAAVGGDRAAALRRLATTYPNGAAAGNFVPKSTEAA